MLPLTLAIRVCTQGNRCAAGLPEPVITVHGDAAPLPAPGRAASHRCTQLLHPTNLLSPAFEVVAAYLGHLPQRGETGLIARSFYGHHHFRLAAGSTAPFAWFGRPQVSVIHLQQPGDEKDFLGGELGVPSIVRCSPGPSR